MEFKCLGNNTILLDKKLNELDLFVAKFVKALKETRYVIVSGYPAILFSRPRMTEDVDLMIEKLTVGKFHVFLNDVLSAGFECLSPGNEKELYNILENGESIRFSRKGKAIPNIELKFVSDNLDKYSLDNALTVKASSVIFRISPMELQIAYKLYLGKGGNEKDIEDARFLYRMFKDNLDMKKLSNFIVNLKVEHLRSLLSD
jgi:hypothetical protein